MSEGTERTRNNLAYLSLGSNIRPERHLPAAVAQLRRFGRVKVVSSAWQSAPVGLAEQPDFVNAAVLLETPLSASALREQAITTIENELGRVRTENKNAPRTIDIDIMLFNDEVFSLDSRRVPDTESPQTMFIPRQARHYKRSPQVLTRKRREWRGVMMWLWIGSGKI
jgi:2-amino-4-hydroxy-6-hydroxymethyldihydropteridine diphosphokinase